MDTRTTSADFYPGGKTPVTAGGGITSGEAGGAAGEPMVPVTKVDELPEHYRESDMRSKINELARVISGGVAAIMAMVSLTLGAEPVKVLGAKKDALWNDDFVVTNVVADFAGFATTNTVTGATNALAATFVRGLEVATNAVLQAGAKEIAAATNALSESVDERLRASTNGSFSATSLEPYAKRTWVEAQGYLKSTNLQNYAQLNWISNQGYIRRDEAQREIVRITEEKIAAQDKTAAYRLMAPDGYEWIDGTGVVWQVRSCVNREWESNVGYGKPNDDYWEWSDGETKKALSISEVEDGKRWEWNYYETTKREDEYGDEEEILEWYKGYSDQKSGEVYVENENATKNRIMRHWIETNAVTRIATMNDMPKVDVSGMLTTNDVCSIVTNEVVEGYSVYVDDVRYPEAEVYFDFIGHEDAEYLYGVRVVGTMIFERACTEKDVNELKSEGFSGITEDRVGDIIQGGLLEVKPVKRNKLGLATKHSLETKRDLTNNVAYAEGIGFSPWEFSCDIPEIHAAVSGAKIEMWYNEEQGNWQVGDLPYVEGWESASGEYVEGGIDATNLLCRAFYFRSGEHAELSAVRKRIVVATPGEVYATPKYIRSTAEEIAREVSKGLVYDYYLTNSVYFIDDVVPTLKYFSPYIRSMYASNRMTAVEIGDQTQVLVTHNAQVNGNLAVPLPGSIRFMSTLDRNAPYDRGRSMTLQDYLDAFNPVLVPETLMLFQTNRSNYSVGEMVVHDGLEVNGDGKNLFRVSANEANFMDVLTVDPDGDSHLYQVSGKFLTDVNGIITNTYAEGGYATPDPLTKVNGNMYVDKSVAVSSNVTVWGKLLISSWDALRVGWDAYRGAIDKGADAGYQDTIKAYVSRLVQPLVDATNMYYGADAFIDVTGRRIYNERGRLMCQWIPVGNSSHQIIILANKGNFNVKLTDSTANNNYIPDSLFFKLGSDDETFSEIRVVFDATGTTKARTIDIGSYNFKGMFPPDSVGSNDMLLEGKFTTLYSSEEPEMRTESILRQEVYTHDNWVWDDEIGDYIIDPDEPTITEVYEWYDEVTYDMIWSIEPGTCWDYKFQRIGEAGMKVDIKRIYKTQPYTGE